MAILQAQAQAASGRAYVAIFPVQAAILQVKVATEMYNAPSDSTDPRQLKAQLAPYPADAMKGFPVSDRVNSALVDEPQLVEPIDLKPEMTTGSLF
jgi:hypothetical protein